MDAQNHQQYLSVKDVAGRYRIGVSTVWEQVAAGRMPAGIKLAPNTTRWRLSDLIDWEAGLASSHNHST
ncbi:helix-turn-helix transcriptional regulator [Salinisphaera orenii]|uniref:helix-turn-helix transcriptional regulator n=1 Tax=Salinisphaera orenii TaxID=856731 RepID=UPI000DBEA174